MVVKYIRNAISLSTGLIYPELCPGCGLNTSDSRLKFCLHCATRLPLTNFHVAHDNPVKRIFGGRLKIAYAGAYLYYRKSGLAKSLITSFKYNNNRDVARGLASLFAAQLQEQLPEQTGIDCLVPVPLHPDKLALRGYNQSQLIAESLGSCLNIPCVPDFLLRVTEGTTQTRKRRYSRWENSRDLFALNPIYEGLTPGHIAIVDDVVTTGATLESAAISILKQHNCQISVLTIGIAVSG